MSLVNKLLSRTKDGENARSGSQGEPDLLDGSLDTLDRILRAMGEFAVELEEEDPRFQDLCKEYARHVTNGAAILDEGIAEATDGARQWGRVRRFYIDRRQRESEFVAERLRNYRLLVEDMVVGLRSIASREETTETSVTDGLKHIEKAADSGDIASVRVAIEKTMVSVNHAFNEQRRLFEGQIAQANSRMLSLREDLANAREDLKHDALTDTYNRGAFDVAMQQAVSLNFILRQPVTVVMLDLDHFKAINDEYGHAAGDDVLRSVADCLSRTFVRRSDVVARYGGEEFALILGDVNAATGEMLVNRFLAMVRETVKIPYGKADSKVTCSGGLTELLPADTVESVLLRADRALYKAKAEGRDRLCVAS
ncbi:MAG: GGDEF domain-containing protein [Pseudomonadota bacterium]